MAEAWESKIVHVSADRWTSIGLPSDVNEQFDKFRADGWELVATEGIVRGRGVLSAGGTVAIVGFFLSIAKPPELQPWGLRVLYLADPTGVLWHIADRRKS